LETAAADWLCYCNIVDNQSNTNFAVLLTNALRYVYYTYIWQKRCVQTGLFLKQSFGIIPSFVTRCS